MWRGVFTPWHQSWHRTHPGFSAGWRGISHKPSLYPLLLFTPSPSAFSPPHSSFTFSLHFSRLLLLSVSPTLYVYFSPSLSPLSFIPSFSPTKTAIHTWHLTADKTYSENAKPAQTNAIAVGTSALRFSPALLDQSCTEGSVFSIIPVWERVRRRRGALASRPLGKNRD